MINELYELSKALNSAKIQTQNWHLKYGAIPNIKANAPCVRITISDGKILSLSAVDEKCGTILRKYGSNQGSYPCMNLASLYRVTDDTIKKELTDIYNHPETLSAEMLQRIKEWCTENNWCEKFLNKYKRSMDSTAAELRSMASQYEPLQVLIKDSQYFIDSAFMHDELEAAVFKMLERRENTELALNILFYQGKKNESADNDYGSISVALESEKLIEMGVPAISEKFVQGLNKCLLDARASQQSKSKTNAVDAFGVSFETIEEPMPNVKLAGGFDVTIRTMFKEQHCQTRYGKIENASYPISPQMRMDFQAALGWISSAERKNITWIKINADKNKEEILFAYPSVMPESIISYTRIFKRPDNREETFVTQSKQFIQELRQTKEAETDTHAKRIRIFILRKIDKARTKIIYTRQTDPYELERCSEEWTLGCSNLPQFTFGEAKVLYPLDTANILNSFWKQNGETATDKFKPFTKYHGIELLMDPDLSVTADLHRMSENAMNMGPFLGNLCAKKDFCHSVWKNAKDMLALIGLLLYRENIRKDDYMDNLPYLYGQLLKATDELHSLYCNVVRGGDIPPRLAGSSLFRNAAEAPVRTLNLLSQRIMPYYSWAKSYRLKGKTENGKESWRAAWLYNICEKTMTKLHDSCTLQTRFSDEEKAQLFIGYLAELPKKEQKENNLSDNEEVTTND